MGRSGDESADGRAAMMGHDTNEWQLCRALRKGTKVERRTLERRRHGKRAEITARKGRSSPSSMRRLGGFPGSRTLDSRQEDERAGRRGGLESSRSGWRYRGRRGRLEGAHGGRLVYSGGDSWSAPGDVDDRASELRSARGEAWKRAYSCY
ncbi:hypothetical protein FKP32DRAFT_1597434 [Trametes sanguinea]|nr:hypothetical protein FKP32DRAFT_1597434 [Trametes sanguinea]